MRNVSPKGRIVLLINLQYHKIDSLIHYCDFYCSKQKLCCYTEYVQHKQSNLFIKLRYVMLKSITSLFLIPCDIVTNTYK